MAKPTIRFRGFDDEWEQRKLGDVLDDMYNGQTPSRNKSEYWNGNIKWLSSGELNRGTVYDSIEMITEDGQKSANLRIVPKGTFIMAITGLEAAGTRGNCALLGFDTTLNQSCMALFPKKDLLTSDFLFQWYRKVGEEYGLNYTQGTKQQSYNAELIKILPISLPSVAEQKKIASYLSHIDHLITLHQRKCDETKKLKKYMLQKMFPQNGSKVPEIRFKGFTDEWEQRKLDDVVEFLDTMRKPLEGAKRISGPYPYYGASGIVDYVDGYLFDEELILLSEDGANIIDRNYPVCFLASGKYWVNNHAHVLRTKQGNENNFICNSLERKDYTQYNTGMAMPKLNKETCKKIPILCPGFEEQKKIGDYFRSLDNLITLHQHKCEEIKKLKKFMLQNMFI
ncbi:restriction endonuclease subunit S [Blautia massiliensis (ex Durand et al. 2017)]|uniref:restriction endonuclease subunit S n=1 Tax=Blautia massiliensis (ex Durand et al. 2017) TaxID=1737424 RepID=UPI0022E47A6A|nr:restriction endonuclease subunit S [Blautia massiliensis (ex Durand et al. 2017)]